MKGIFDWLTKNKVGISILSITLVAGIGLAVLQGCQLTDLVKVDVPSGVQKATSSPSRVTLTVAPEIMEDYRRHGERFKANIERGDEMLGFLSSMANITIEMGTSAIPGGALGLSILTGLGGLFLKGPGTSREKNDSYNKGLKEGQRIASEISTLIKTGGSA